MSAVAFSKYQACENDFIVVVDTPLTPTEAIGLCHRRRGIGADGVLLLSRPDELWHMRIVNADGSEAEMCGNGFRCAVKHLVDRQLAAAPIRIATEAGVLGATFSKGDDGKVAQVTVDMGPPRSAVEKLSVTIGDRVFSGSAVSMGNPHFVIQSEAPAKDAALFGLALSTHEKFPRGCNVEFVAWYDGAAECVVYERGAGLTQACGTGACAVAVVGQSLGRRIQEVQLPGGTLHIELTDTVRMTGPVAWVFDGER